MPRKKSDEKTGSCEVRARKFTSCFPKAKKVDQAHGCKARHLRSYGVCYLFLVDLSLLKCSRVLWDYVVLGGPPDPQLSYAHRAVVRT